MSEREQTKFPFYAPRTWHGMTAPVWLRMLARNRFSISPSRLPLAFSITGLSCLNLIGSGIENLLYGRRARSAEIRPPLFILGHWRTGTTRLHELLVQDEQFSCATMYRCMAPHNFLHTEWFVTPWLGRLLPACRPTDNMPFGLDRPQEDEFALCNLGVPSPYLSWAFPRGSGYQQYLDLRELSQPQREAWKQTFVRYLQRLSIKAPGRLVLKSPTHTARVRTLLELFPNAQFVYTARNPFAAVPSTIRMWRRMEDVLGLSVPGRSDLEDYLFELSMRMHRCFEEDRKQLQARQLCEIRFENLIESPLATLQQIYERLELGGFERARPRFESYISQTRGYRPGQHELSAALEQRIARQWAGYLERYGYAPSGAPVA